MKFCVDELLAPTEPETEAEETVPEAADDMLVDPGCELALDVV